jgi:DeoR/GlpR family transcriptional regulator of sugar metabolism
MRQATKHRHEQILTELTDRKHATVKDLADVMRVSEATVRRDLRALADSQKLNLVHGGATMPRDLLSRDGGTREVIFREIQERDHSFHARHDRNLDAKRIIAGFAAALVPDGAQLFLDSGTTAFEMAPFLSKKRGLSVLLNSSRLALELKGADCQIILLGGQFRPERMDTVGPVALATLEQVRGFTAFLGADGLSMDLGPAAVDMESAHLYRRAAHNAEQTVLLVDHTKFAAPALFPIVDWEKIDRVVTDREPSPEWINFLRTREVDLTFPTLEMRGY